MPDPLNIRLPLDLKIRLQAIAEQNHFSVSDIVRIVLVTRLPEVEQGILRLCHPGPRADQAWRH